MAASITIDLGTGSKCTSGWTAPPTWAASTAYGLNAGVEPPTPNGHHYLCTQAGTSGGADPFDIDDENWDTINDGGVIWTCFDEFTNPQHVTGEGFGHAFQGGLYYSGVKCSPPVIDTTASGTSGAYFDGTDTYYMRDISACNEVPFAYGNILPGGELVGGNTHEMRITWKKGSETIGYYNSQFVWDDGWDWGQFWSFIGFLPCWWRPGGSVYGSNGIYQEITEAGTDYSVTMELWDITVSPDVMRCTDTAEFIIRRSPGIEAIEHTKIYGNIEDYTGAAVNGNFGVEAIIDLQSDDSPCVYPGFPGWGEKGEEYIRVKNQDNTYAIDNADGMVGSVNVKIYRSGYVIPTEAVIVTAKTFNELNFTGTKYLQAACEGIVHDADDNPLPNANVWGEYSTYRYGCKTAADGKYALPIHAEVEAYFNIKATKNNHNIITHPTPVWIYYTNLTSWDRNFTGANKLTRVSAYPSGAYAHLNSLAVDDQSVIIPDNPVIGEGLLITPDTPVGVTIVKAKTRKWGAGAAMGTGNGAADSGIGYGADGRNYEGDMGAAEDWEWEE